MLGALTILGGVLMIVLESILLRLFGIQVWAPQLAVLAVVYVALQRDFATAAVAALIFSGVADVCWGGPRGYYALGLTATFLAVTAVGQRWRPRGLLRVAALLIPGVMLTDLVALSSLTLFYRGGSPLGSFLALSPLMALWTALVALPLIWLQLRLDRFVEHRRAAAL